MTNPWLPSPDVEQPSPLVVSSQPVSVWQPQRLDVAAHDALPVRPVGEHHRLWVVGAHGGAGTSTWAQILGCGDSGQAWPLTGMPVRVVVAARTHRYGLEAARRAAIQWAGGVLTHVELVGLLLSPDAPGRVPKPLREVVQNVSGAFPQVFHVPWVEAWRVFAAGEVVLDKKTVYVRDVLSQMK